jgi:hypothetical protein
MTTYYLSVGFDAADTQSDQLHFDADYGFASSTANAGATSLGNSGPQGRSFETVHLSAGGSGQPNQLVIALFTSLWSIDQTQSYFRVSFRPAHDVTPADNVQLSPLSQGDTNKLIAGIAIDSRQNQNADVDGSNWGLPAGNNVTQFLYSGYQLSGAPPNATSQHFEVTVEISILIGTTWTYYKVDPEMVIDF